MSRLRHWLLHLFHWQPCEVTAGYDAEGRYWVSARCVICGAVSEDAKWYPTRGGR